MITTPFFASIYSRLFLFPLKVLTVSETGRKFGQSTAVRAFPAETAKVLAAHPAFNTVRTSFLSIRHIFSPGNILIKEHS